MTCAVPQLSQNVARALVKEKSVFAEVLHELLEDKKYSFGEPWQLTSESLSAVVPILQNSAGNRGYIVAQEISGDKISVMDSGHIGKLRVKTADVQKPVFVRAGTIFKGQGTQSRAVNMGICLEPEKESLIDVFCVHASHRISADSHFSMERDIAPRTVEDVLTSPIKNQSRIWAAAGLRKWRAQTSNCPQCGSERIMQSYDAELVRMNCGNVVPAVSTQNRFVNSLHPSYAFADNLAANLREMNEFNKRIDGMLSKVPADLAKQVGMVMIDSKGVYGLEMFDHPDSWRAFSKSVVRNYADVLAKERAGDGLFALKVERIPRAIKEFLRKAEGLTENSVFENKISETWTLSGGLIGEYSTLGHGFVHLILKRVNAVCNQ